MYPVQFSVTLGFVVIAGFLTNLRALPIPTTPLPQLPRRFIEPPFDKDPFKDGYPVEFDPKRTIAQQAHENIKKLPRNWGTPSAEFYENNFYSPNPFKDQELRGLLEPNGLQPEFSDAFKKSYFNNYEYEGHHAEEEDQVEEESNSIESNYPGEQIITTLNHAIDSSYPADQNSYQLGMGFPVFTGGEAIDMDYDINVDIEVDLEIEFNVENEDYDNGSTDLLQISPSSTTYQISSMNNLGSKKLQQPVKQSFGQPTQQILNVLNNMLNPDWDSGDSRSRELRSVPKPNPKSYAASMTPQPLSAVPLQPNIAQQHPLPVIPEAKTKPIKESKPISVEEQIPAVPIEKELFSRTTTITKTTTWYVNNDNEIVVEEEIDIKPRLIKGKYVKTSKTTTSGPVPWYLEGFEEVIFEEEDEKSKTILDKMTYLKGMNPTSITSYTTAPNPWSTEFHEEVVFEELLEKKKGDDHESKTHSLGPHPSSLEHGLDYFPRTHLVPEEVDFVEEGEEPILEFEIVFLEEEEEYQPTVEILPQPEGHVPGQIQLKEFPSYPIPVSSPKPFINSPQFQQHHPSYQSIEVESLYVEDHRNYLENPYMSEVHSTINPNQLTTQKPLQSPPSSDSTFTPHSQINHNQINEQTHPQPNLHHPTQSQIFGNHPQTSMEHPGPGNRRDKWEHPQQSSREHPQNSNREQHPRSSGEQPDPPHYKLTEPNQQVMSDGGTRHPQDTKLRMGPSDSKRSPFHNRQQQGPYQNRQPRPRDL